MMPLYRHKGTLIYFAHVPKCAGSSLSTHLLERFGAVALEDRSHIRESLTPAWTRTSPQHITAAALERILPQEFYDVGFSVIRHPELRLKSIYQFQKYSQKRIPKGLPFGIWLRSVPWILKYRPFALDGHLNPQIAFLPKGVKLFRLEDGLEAVKEFLDHITGVRSELSIGHEKKAHCRIELTDTDQRLIREIYAADYDRFGYE